MKTENEYVDALIEKYSPLVTTWDCYLDTPRNEDDVKIDATKCAIIDVENTIEALEGLECNYYRTRYFNIVLQILKDKL